MPTYFVDPVTGIIVPTAGQDPGTHYATSVSNALLTLAHLTHTGVANLDGYQIPSAGLNIDADLSFNDHNLTNVRSLRMQSQPSTLVGVGDVNNLYVDQGNLWFNNGSGTPVEITSGAVVNVTASNNYNLKAITNNYTINPSDGYVVFDCDPTSNTILITLPLANSVPTGRFYFVKDVPGQAHTHNITVQKAGSDTVDGASNTIIDFAHGAVGLIGDGVSKWTVWAFNRDTYTTGRTLTLDSGSTLSVSGVMSLTGTSATTLAAGGTFTAQASSAVTINPGSTLYLDGYERVETGGILKVQSGAIGVFDLGATLFIDGYEKIDSGGFLEAESGSTLNLLNGSTMNLAGTQNVTSTGVFEVKSGGGVRWDAGSNAAIHNAPIFDGGATFQGSQTYTVSGFDTILNIVSSAVLDMDSSTAANIAGPITSTNTIHLQVVTTSASTYNALTTDTVILCDTTSTAITVNPPSGPSKGRWMLIKNNTASGNAVTVAFNVDAGGSASLGAKNEIQLVYSGSTWFRLGT